MKRGLHGEITLRDPVCGIPSASGLRFLSAVCAAVPVRLIKRDPLVIFEKLVSIIEENRVAI
jgi:hypothetical protein